MRGTSSGGKTKTKMKPTRRVGSKVTATKKPKVIKLVIFNEIDITPYEDSKQYVYRFSLHSIGQQKKIKKPVVNWDYFEIQATKAVAFRFAEKWAKAKRLAALYLVSITEPQTEE